MPMLPITSLYAAILALLLLKLAFGVIKIRQFHKSGLGYEHKDLLLAGRTHANATEYVPISLILLAIAELNGVPGIMLHIPGIVLVVARIGHARGFKLGSGGAHPGRYLGTLLTWMVIAWLSFINIYYSGPYLF